MREKEKKGTVKWGRVSDRCESIHRHGVQSATKPTVYAKISFIITLQTNFDRTGRMEDVHGQQRSGDVNRMKDTVIPVLNECPGQNSTSKHDHTGNDYRHRPPKRRRVEDGGQGERRMTIRNILHLRRSTTLYYQLNLQTKYVIPDRCVFKPYRKGGSRESNGKRNPRARGFETAILVRKVILSNYKAEIDVHVYHTQELSDFSSLLRVWKPPDAPNHPATYRRISRLMRPAAAV